VFIGPLVYYVHRQAKQSAAACWYTGHFRMDFVQAYLLVALGAAISNALDNIFKITPAVAAWLDRFLEP
jgi:hypothetical protein